MPATERALPWSRRPRPGRPDHASRDDEWRRLRSAGLLLALATTGWVLVSASAGGGRPLPVAGVVVAVVVAVLGTGGLPERLRTAAVWLVAGSPLVVGLVHQRSLLGDGPLGYANASGALLVVAGAAAITLALSTNSAAQRGVLTLVSMAWLLLPWLMRAQTAALTGVAIAVVALVRPRLRRRPTLATVAVLLTGLVTVVSLLGLGYEPGPRSSLPDRVVDRSMGELRVRLWHDAIELAAEEPVTGVGPGRFAEASPTAADRDDAAWAHSEVLQTAAETGVPGAVLLVALVAWAFAALGRGLADPRTAVVLVAVLGVTTNAVFDYVWHSPEVPLASALLIGATIRLGAPAPNAARRSRTVSRVVAATGLLWVLLVVPVAPLNPAHVEPNGAQPSPEHAVVFTEPGIARTDRAPAALYRRLQRTGELSIEFWVATDDLAQDGPARIVSSSRGIVHRNFTVGQAGERLVLRLRTTATDWNAAEGAIEVPDVFVDRDFRHVVVTTDLRTVHVFVDGDERWDGPAPGGGLSGWNHTYPLLLGNEATGDRPWVGALGGLAIHDRVLSPAQVRERQRGGPPGVDGGRAPEPAAVALYVAGSAADRVLEDRSAAALGGDLHLPEEVETPPPGLVTTIRSSEPSPTRLVGHAALFGFWAVAVAAVLGRRMRLAGVGTLLGLAAAATAAAASVARYQTGRSPSWLDVLAAVIGAGIGGAVFTSLRVRRPARRGPWTEA